MKISKEGKKGGINREKGVCEGRDWGVKFRNGRETKQSERMM